jgi:hypothetical protein
MYEDLAAGLGQLLQDTRDDAQVLEGMIGILADWAYVKRQFDLAGRADALLAFIRPQQQRQMRPPPGSLNGGGYPLPYKGPNGPVYPPPGSPPYNDRLREAMSRAAQEPDPEPGPIPQPAEYDRINDPLKIYTKYAPGG